MSGITIADLNHYLHRALLAANRFVQEETSQLFRYQRSQAHYIKYFDLFERRLLLKIGLFVAPLAHLSAVMQEGIVVQPVAIEFVRGVVPEGWEFTTSLLIAALLFWCSLAVGHFLHSVSISKDALAPGRYHIENRMSLLAALLIALLYLWILYQLVRIASGLAGEYHTYTTFILIFGLVELFLGYLAVLGWELIIVYTKQALLRRAYHRGEYRLLRYAKQCSHNYRFFLQTKDMLNTQQQQYFIGPSSSEKVRIAIDYYQRYLGRRENVRLLNRPVN